jgi:hypothetical protein
MGGLLRTLDDPALALVQWNEAYGVVEDRLPAALAAQLEARVAGGWRGSPLPVPPVIRLVPSRLIWRYCLDDHSFSPRAPANADFAAEIEQAAGLDHAQSAASPAFCAPQLLAAMERALEVGGPVLAGAARHAWLP